jgi:hypothetical protein
MTCIEVNRIIERLFGDAMMRVEMGGKQEGEGIAGWGRVDEQVCTLIVKWGDWRWHNQ